MDYQKLYDKIIQRAKQRDYIEGYCEKHHIVPRCMGGTNDESNLVKLTAREHFICHWLLARIENSPKLWFAFSMMCRVKNSNHKRHTPSSRAYNEAKYKIAQIRKGKPRSEETRNKISAANKGRKRTQSEIENISRKLTGLKRSEETKIKISISKIGDKNPTKNPDVALKISNSKKGMVSNRKGETLSDYTKSLISKAQKGVKKGKQIIIKCNHCNKEGGSSAIKRWHNDNCKHK
jgi:hypothetical protein